MKLYNTLTRTNETLLPLNEPEVTIYTCGPTVYDYSHIGHWFTYVRWDMVVRTLRLSGYTPKWVMNITDVGHLVSDADEGEDKLEKGARREGKTAWEVAEYYTADFLEGMNLLGITPPDFLTKATEHIPEQIQLIQQLEEKGFTYVIDDGVYFDTSKFEGYAHFAQLDQDDLTRRWH
jgi:cysteinyl-tRNA synthetase